MKSLETVDALLYLQLLRAEETLVTPMTLFCHLTEGFLTDYDFVLFL